MDFGDAIAFDVIILVPETEYIKRKVRDKIKWKFLLDAEEAQ